MKPEGGLLISITVALANKISDARWKEIEKCNVLAKTYYQY